MVRGFTHLKTVVFLSVLDPGLALTLRVDQQWVPTRLGYNDPVLNGQLVVRQSLQIPLSNLHNSNNSEDAVNTNW